MIERQATRSAVGKVTRMAIGQITQIKEEALRMAVRKATILNMFLEWRWITTKMPVRQNTRMTVGQTTKTVLEQAVQMAELRFKWMTLGQAITLNLFLEWLPRWLRG